MKRSTPAKGYETSRRWQPCRRCGDHDQEERLILGGNTSVASGTTPTPSLVGSGSGGTLAAGTWSVIAVALSLQAYLDVVGVNNGAIGRSLAIASATVPDRLRAPMRTERPTHLAVARRRVCGGYCRDDRIDFYIAATVANSGNGAVGYAWFWVRPG